MMAFTQLEQFATKAMVEAKPYYDMGVVFVMTNLGPWIAGAQKVREKGGLF